MQLHNVFARSSVVLRTLRWDGFRILRSIHNARSCVAYIT